MTLSQTISDINRMLTGIEVQEAVNIVVDYICKTNNFTTPAAAHGYWAGLTDDEKVQVMTKALTR